MDDGTAGTGLPSRGKLWDLPYNHAYPCPLCHASRPIGASSKSPPCTIRRGVHSVLDKAVLMGICRGGRARRNVDVRPQSLDVRGGGQWTDEQRLCNFAVRVALSQQSKDIELAGGKPCDDFPGWDCCHRGRGRTRSSLQRFGDHGRRVRVPSRVQDRCQRGVTEPGPDTAQRVIELAHCRKRGSRLDRLMKCLDGCEQTSRLIRRPGIVTSPYAKRSRLTSRSQCRCSSWDRWCGGHRGSGAKACPGSRPAPRSRARARL